MDELLIGTELYKYIKAQLDYKITVLLEKKVNQLKKSLEHIEEYVETIDKVHKEIKIDINEIAKRSYIIKNPTKIKKTYVLLEEDIDKYIQTMKIIINNRSLLQDSNGFLYSDDEENNIVGKILDEVIEWYE